MARQIKYLLFHFLSSQRQQQQQLDLIIFHSRLFNKFSSTRRLPRRCIGKKLKNCFLKVSLYNTNIRLCRAWDVNGLLMDIHSLQCNQPHSLHLTAESLSLSLVVVVKKWNESINLTCTYSEKKYTKNMKISHDDALAAVCSHERWFIFS